MKDQIKLLCIVFSISLLIVILYALLFESRGPSTSETAAKEIAPPMESRMTLSEDHIETGWYTGRILTVDSIEYIIVRSGDGLAIIKHK